MNLYEQLSKLEEEQKANRKEMLNVEGMLKLKKVYAKYEGEDKVVSFRDTATRLKNAPQELQMMSGWVLLDSILKGFRLQQVVVVSALPKSGKTTWLMDLTNTLKEFNVMWLPFEEGAEELIRKYLERGQEPPHGYSPEVMKGNTMEWIENRIVESIAKYNTQVVIIDQLDFIVAMGGDNHSLRVGQAMRDLKGLAKKWDICIFLICHLVKTKMDIQPTLEDLKGSSSIAQEADTVIILWRESRRKGKQMVITNNMNVSVQANRRTGTTGNVKMLYDNGHFTEFDWKEEDERDDLLNSYTD